MNSNFSVIFDNKNTVLYAPGFSIPLSLDCGQAFRWKSDSNGVFSGVAGGRFLRISQTGDKITFFDMPKEDFETFWSTYFDLDRDYETIKSNLSTDGSLKKAIDCCGGIRILHQDPWEALCSFIISQNNNIPRIKGIVERLCMLLGEEIAQEIYAFPSPETIVNAGVDALIPIRSGFRAKYIYDAACRVVSGEIDFKKIAGLPLADAENELKKIKGVGPKVAQCALLYGLGRVDAFPVDVWVNRIMSEMYPNGLPECTYGVEGIAQQYLFHWRRTALTTLK